MEEIDQNKYEFAVLSHNAIQQIRSLEETVNKEEKERVILIAYQSDEN